MRMHLIKRIRRFFRTTLVGGFGAILPLGLLVLFFRWVISLIERYLGPLVEKLDPNSVLKEILIYLLTIAAILTVFFVIGLIIQTRLGRFFNKVFEEKYLMKIPGYKMTKETVMQFFGKNRSFFSAVVLIDVFGSGTLMTGFITDDHGEFITVFVPTGPNPTSGNIYHVKREKIIKTTIPVDIGMKTIISCGAGSEEIFKNQKKIN